MTDNRLQQLVADIIFDCMCHNLSVDKTADAAIALVLEEAAHKIEAMGYAPSIAAAIRALGDKT